MVENDLVSRRIAKRVVRSLQQEYPRQLPDSAILGWNKRVPQDVALISGMFLEKLIADHGLVDLLGGGWECQSVSRAGRHEGIYDPRFAYFYDLLRITNWLQDEQPQGLAYVFKNTHPGERQAPNVQKASEMVLSTLGAPVIADAGGMGAAAHKLRLF